MILVLGGTGQIGLPLVRSLVASGVEFRALAHSEESASALRLPGVDVVTGDIRDVDALARHLSGVDQLFLLTPGDRNQVAQQNAIVDRAARAGVAAIVKLSVYTAAPDAFAALSAGTGRTTPTSSTVG